MKAAQAVISALLASAALMAMNGKLSLFTPSDVIRDWDWAKFGWFVVYLGAVALPLSLLLTLRKPREGRGKKPGRAPLQHRGP